MPRKQCKYPGCDETPALDFYFCNAHWRALPDDLQERLMWAATEKDTTEWRAALNAARDYLEG